MTEDEEAIAKAIEMAFAGEQLAKLRMLRLQFYGQPPVEFDETVQLFEALSTGAASWVSKTTR
jgi:hypothetical protein